MAGQMPGILEEGARYAPGAFEWPLPLRQRMYGAVLQRTQKGVAPALAPFLGALPLGGIRDPELRAYAGLAHRMKAAPPGSPQHYQAVWQLAQVAPQRMLSALGRSGLSPHFQRGLDFWRSQAYVDPRYTAWPAVGSAVYMKRLAGGLPGYATPRGAAAPASFWRDYYRAALGGTRGRAATWQYAQRMPAYPHRTLAGLLGGFLQGRVSLNELLRAAAAQLERSAIAPR